MRKAGSRIRTDDRLITNQVLYQLSYTGGPKGRKAAAAPAVKVCGLGCAS